jgi:Icc-related predicted phosphoesterase
MKKDKKYKIAAVGDIHVNTESKGKYKELFDDVCKKADILALCGDLTQRGLVEEIEILLQELEGCTIPKVAVLGNHDYEAGRHDEIVKLLAEHKIHVLDEEPYKVNGIGIAGVKGFCGGFGDYMLEVWGEEAIKKFYYEGMNEVDKLENALAKLQTEKKIVILHYSPIRETVVGEPEEIYTYLGSSRLEIPINSYDVNVVFHGHAHHGAPEGKTSQGIPVYNVAHALMTHHHPKQPYALVEI